jgi:hypothetical protein
MVPNTVSCPLPSSPVRTGLLDVDEQSEHAAPRTGAQANEAEAEFDTGRSMKINTTAKQRGIINTHSATSASPSSRAASSTASIVVGTPTSGKDAIAVGHVVKQKSMISFFSHREKSDDEMIGKLGDNRHFCPLEGCLKLVAKTRDDVWRHLEVYYPEDIGARGQDFQCTSRRCAPRVRGEDLIERVLEHMPDPNPTRWACL